jgi:thiamine biosynthesis lipoprotein
MSKFALCLVASVSLLAGPTHSERTADAMGTTFTIEAYGDDPQLFEAAAARAFDELRRLDRMMSNYIPESELSRVNESAADGPVKVSRELFELLEMCIEYGRRSESSFDITVGPLMKVWGFYKGSGHLPRRAEIQAALQHTGYQNLELDGIDGTVRFKKHGMSLDPGGVGKGYAVDRMAAVLRQTGIRCALISAGGSSIYAIGAPPDDTAGWLVRIRDPRHEQKTAAEVHLKNESLSTSGSYEKFFWAEGEVYSHIMDPLTGYPAKGMLSVSVISPRTLDSEIWAKPYYIRGRVWTEQHKPKEFRVLLCEDKPGARCAWVP